MPGNFCPRDGKACPSGRYGGVGQSPNFTIISILYEKRRQWHATRSAHPDRTALAVGSIVMKLCMKGLDRMALRLTLAGALAASIWCAPPWATAANATEGVRENQLGPWRSMLTDQYAKGIVKAGGFGLANQIYKAMVARPAARSA
jgi:Rod binding protein